MQFLHMYIATACVLQQGGGRRWNWVSRFDVVTDSPSTPDAGTLFKLCPREVLAGRFLPGVKVF